MSRHPEVRRARPGRLSTPSAPFAPATLALAAALTLLASGAQAFEFDTGNPDLTVRWDNTPRANLAWRVEGRDAKIGATAIADEGTYSFDKGDMVAKRVDLLTELDVIYKKNFGARFSAAGWYDGAYSDDSRGNPAIPNPSYIGNRYSEQINRLYQGPGGEILDAFVFGRFDLGEVPTSVKLGRHSLYWGESLFLGGNVNGIAYAQNPLDLQKGFATPGVEAKELFRPLNQISGQAALTDTLTVAAQYFFEWESFRYPEGGTYLGPVDFAFNGPDRVVAGQLPVNPALGPLSGQLLGYSRGEAAEPKQRGDWGLAARWSPEALDGTVGFYYRNFSDKLPQTLVTQVALTPPLPPSGNRLPLLSGSQYNLVYKDNIQLFGVSLAKNIGGISLGSEFSYRKDTPLNAQVLGIAPGLPEQGETKGPVGDTAHGLVNLLGVIPKTALFDAATWATELTWAHLVSVNSGENLFNGEGYAPCTSRNFSKWDGCATKNFFGLALAFTPTWYQTFPGVDLSLPVSYSRGLSGNSALVFGGNQGLGNYSVGLGIDVFQKYRFDIKYSDYIGAYKDNGTSVTSTNGFTTYLVDRGFLGVTFKTTF
jgi:hypothetical protein